MKPFNEVYHPWNWRGWWDYGTGALGDMACHILHPVFEGLKLGYPSKAQASSSLLLNDSAPVSQAAKLTFPSRGRQGRMKLPEVDLKQPLLPRVDGQHSPLLLWQVPN